MIQPNKTLWSRTLLAEHQMKTALGEGDTVLPYLIWSNKHNAWWGPEGWGYQTVEASAGRFTKAEAIETVVRSADCGRLDQVNCMVLAPEAWRNWHV